MTTIEQQIEQIKSLADRQYPDPAEQEAKMAYRCGLLETRLREYDRLYLALPVRDSKVIALPVRSG